MDFIYSLYQQDNFVLILAIILVVLVILFAVIYFWGKKDKELEETRKLQKIEVDTFKEEEKEIPLEVKEEVVEEVKLTEEDANVTLFEPTIKEEEELPILEEVVKPILSDSDSDEAKPIALSELDNEDVDLSVLENIKNEFNELALPVEEVEEEKPLFKPSPQIFSSVFVNKPQDNNEEVSKTEVIEEPKKVEPKLFSIALDDEDIELPSLNDNVNKIEGESYEVN